MAEPSNRIETSRNAKREEAGETQAGEKFGNNNKKEKRREKKKGKEKPKKKEKITVKADDRSIRAA